MRLSREVRPGTLIFDDNGKKLGKIIELIGPVKAPYASVALISSRIGKSGDPAFSER